MKQVHRSHPLLLLLLVFVLFTSTVDATSQQKSEDHKPSVSVGQVKPLLYGKDHVSEGVLAPLDNGRILLVFRLDPGRQGHHVGRNARIMQVTYDPETDR